MDTGEAMILVIIIANLIISYKGFKDLAFFDAWSFDVERILIYKEYRRLITSGFLHVGWIHLLFNMLTLYFFSHGLAGYLGIFPFLLVYFISLICGNLFALFIHRHHNDYSSVGASGAVCGIIFATIGLFPGMRIGFFILPFAMPAWLYGLLYIGLTIYGIKSKADNIGHEAHLGGALAGMAVAIMMHPSSLTYNYFPVLLIAVPSLLFIFLCIVKPEILLVDNYFSKQKNYHTIEDKYNAEKRDKQQEIDRLLEKIHRKGVNSLTRKEKDTLGIPND